MMKKKNNRHPVVLGWGLALMLAACAMPPAPAAPSATVAAPAAEAPTAKKIKIVMDAQMNTPTPANAQLAAGETNRIAMQVIADEYMKLHPNVEIEWYRFPSATNRDEWMVARMTAQDMPDIFWMNTESMAPHVGKGWFLPMDEYLKMPNPYVKDNGAWKDQFQDVSLFSQIGPDGKSYGVNMDGAGVLTVYNKDAFKKAGITEMPKAWNDFLVALQKLKDAGYIPYGADLAADNCCFAHWFSAHIYSQLVYDKLAGWDDDKNDNITSRELVTHAQKGSFPDWDAYLQMAKMLKEFSQYFPTGFEGNVDYRQLFRQGKVAMYMEGNWATGGFKSSPPPFEIDWMPFPTVTKDNYAGAANKVVRIQGAWGAMQYHVPAFVAQKDPEKLAAIMDWLMFLSKPENVSKVVQESGLLPLVKGGKTTPEMEPFLGQYDRAVPFQSWQTLSTAAMNTEYKQWQGWLTTSMSDAEFLEIAKAGWKAEVDKVIEANPTWKTQ
jgi:ABC-type glycerol-3-phosphate transport system substrate-binding protein